MLKKKSEYIICPFCCHRFHPNEADFRLGSVISLAAKKSKPVPDEKLYNYYINILNSSLKDAKASSMQQPTVSLGDEGIIYCESDTNKYGFTQHVTYTNSEGVSEVTDRRLCPNCHNNLPTGYGMRDTVLLSILGDARSGKSVYLTMLINQLENNPDFVSKLTFIGDKTARDSFYETYQRPLFKEHTLISSTKRKKIPPFAFNYWYQYKDETGATQENSIDLIFYDIAGEDLRDDTGIRKNGFNIKDSNGLIFLVDPTNFSRMSDLFLFSDANLIEAIPEQNSNQAVFDTMYNYFLAFSEKSQIPFALTISKTDLFRYVNFDFFGNKPFNRIQHMINDEYHRGAVDMPNIKAMDHEVRELLTHLGEDGILNNATGCFKNVVCFAVSSLGRKPSVQQISDPVTNETVEKGLVDGPLEPFKVKDPFYWILMRNKLLYKHENNRYTLHGETIEKPVSWWQRFVNFLRQIRSS